MPENCEQGIGLDGLTKLNRVRVRVNPSFWLATRFDGSG